MDLLHSKCNIPRYCQLSVTDGTHVHVPQEHFKISIILMLNSTPVIVNYHSDRLKRGMFYFILHVFLYFHHLNPLTQNTFFNHPTGQQDTISLESWWTDFRHTKACKISARQPQHRGHTEFTGGPLWPPSPPSTGAVWKDKDNCHVIE